MAIIKHPTELTPGTLHHLIFLGDVIDEPFAEEAPRGWCRFERWERIRLADDWSFYARFIMTDGSVVMLSVDMVTGKEHLKNLWDVIRERAVADEKS